MSMEHWWNDTDRGKSKYGVKELSQCHLALYKCHMDWPGMEFGPPLVRYQGPTA
jgi:hypothetical protein